MQPDASAALLDAYVERRAALIRFFTARTGSSAQAEDIVQDMFLRLEAMTPQMRADVRNPQAFLYRLGSNLMLDAIKQRQRGGRRDAEWRASQSDSFGGVDVADAPSSEDAVYARMKLDKIVAALDGLNPNCRQAFRMHKLEGLSQADTAKAMGVTASSVEKYIATVIQHLLKEVGWP